MTGDVYRPYHHVAPVTGKPTVFANLEYVQGRPPRIIQVGDDTWVLREAVHEIVARHG